MSQKYKILHVVNNLSPSSTPIEWLNNFDTNVFDIYVMSLLNKGQISANTNVKVRTTRAIGRNDWQAYLDFYCILKEIQPDIIHTHANVSGFLGAVFGKINKTKVVDTEHNDHKGFNKIGLLLNCVAMKIADVVICNSKNTLNSFYMFEKFLIKNKQKSIIYNGVDIEWIDREYGNKDKASQEWNLEDKFVIGNIGRLTKQKDQRTIILGIKKIINTIPNLKLIIVGSGKLEKNLKDLVMKNDLGKYVCFTGLLNRKKVYQLLHCFDVFVMSSLWEGFCNAVVEAMAARIPVIVTKVGPLPEVVGDSGIYVAPNKPQVITDAILELKDDPKKAKKIGEAGRKRVLENFSMRKTVENYEKLYNQLLKKEDRLLSQRRGDCTKHNEQPGNFHQRY